MFFRFHCLLNTFCSIVKAAFTIPHDSTTLAVRVQHTGAFDLGRDGGNPCHQFNLGHFDRDDLIFDVMAAPSLSPTPAPTNSPTVTAVPTESPSNTPSDMPSRIPSGLPSLNPSVNAETATYDSVFQAPRCTDPTNPCDTGSLVVGRGNVEPNAPNVS